MAADASSPSPDLEPDERDRFERKVFAELTAPPSKDSGYWLSNRLIRAFSSLLHEGLSTPDDDPAPYDLDKTKAVICLTWLLTDKSANLHALGEAFGPWLDGQREYAQPAEDDEFALALAAKGRAIARCATLDELNGADRAGWMQLTERAWQLIADPPLHPTDYVTSAWINKNTTLKVSAVRAARARDARIRTEQQRGGPLKYALPDIERHFGRCVKTKS
jgi:hypothetical protein